jgi:hypothetical protein
MAKAKGTSNSQKVTFGKRRNGKAKKNRNKHDHKSKTYRGQGR